MTRASLSRAQDPGSAESSKKTNSPHGDRKCNEGGDSRGSLSMPPSKSMGLLEFMDVLESEPDWKVRSPFSSLRGYGRTGFLTRLLSYARGAVQDGKRTGKSVLLFTPLRGYGRTGFLTRLRHHVRRAVQDVKRTGKSVLLFTSLRGYGRTGFPTRLRPHCTASCAGCETDWKVRSPLHHFEGTGERVFLPVSFPCSAGCAGCATDWKVRSPLHHSEGTGERVFLPVCVLMLGWMCRM